LRVYDHYGLSLLTIVTQVAHRGGKDVPGLSASISLSALAVAMAAPAIAQVPPTQVAGAQVRPDEEIIVTGVLTGAQVAPSIAVSVINSEQLRLQAPVSTADILRNVPGVFVNSALGEVRNIVYSRGISANSAEAASGYYYVSLQEDGLPVTNVTASNYSPDFFLRQDITTARVEALRGGTAVVTGPNAPGGIFNYISRNGKTDPGL
jgi:iron complex outermembrane recepter protein